MLRLAADENFNNLILRGVLRRKPDCDIVRAQDSEVAGSDDETLLEWAAGAGRILLTHDVSTLSPLAWRRAEQGLPMPGVFEIAANSPIGQAVEENLLLAEGSIEG